MKASGRGLSCGGTAEDGRWTRPDDLNDYVATYCLLTWRHHRSYKGDCDRRLSRTRVRSHFRRLPGCPRCSGDASAHSLHSEEAEGTRPRTPGWGDGGH